MHIELRTASGRAKCRFPSCEGNPKYIDMYSKKIKKGTICCYIEMYAVGGQVYGFYCRECMEKIYIDMKSKLDPKFWVFL